MNDTQEGIIFENLVVRPIKNGYLVEIETENETITVAAKSWRQVIAYIKKVGRGTI